MWSPLCLVLQATATLNLTRGLEGTRAVPGAGLTDKQLGLLNWFKWILRGTSEHATGAAAAADTVSYTWPAPPWTVLEHQTGLGSVRYQVAFSAYAVAELTAAHTPAFPGLASSILRDAFARLVHPTSWGYWDTPGACGSPWTEVCAATNLSMCELNPLGHRSDWCPDPVKYQNVMYSGHLAHVGALYELFSGEHSLTSEGWAFDGPPNTRRGRGPIRYTLPKLFEAIHAQTKWSTTGGFACEPTVVYLVCNQHTYTAARLYDALHQTAGRYSSERRKWLDYLRSTAVRHRPKDMLGEGYLEILYQEQLRESSPTDMPWVELLDLGGCAGNDGWAAMALGFWAADDESSGGANLLRGVRSSLAANKQWAAASATPGGGDSGEYLKQGQFYEGRGYTSELATSWAGAALGGWSGEYASRVEAALRHMEHQFGEAMDTDGDGMDDSYHYRIERQGFAAHEQMWATANLAISMARDDGIVASVYDGSLLMRARAQPHLVSISPGAPAALVRRAVFDTDDDGGTSGTLRLALATTSKVAVKQVALRVQVPTGWKRAGVVAPNSFVMHVDIPAREDALVQLRFERSVVTE